MKRNILIVLTLALVCVLFVACGKEETPVDVAIGELQAARENIDNQIAALEEAQKPATKGGGGTTAVHLVAAGQPTPVEKTREEMTEEEKEAYDKTKVEELNDILKGLEGKEFEKHAEEAIKNNPNVGWIKTGDGKYDYELLYVPGLEYLSMDEELYSLAISPSNAVFILRCATWEFFNSSCERALETFEVHPELIVPAVKLYGEQCAKYGGVPDEDEFTQGLIELLGW